MKKLLIIYGSYGSGHKSIAEAIGNYFTDNSNDYEVKIFDIAKYANFSGKVSLKVFDFVINHRTELLFNISYELVDNKLAAYSQVPIVKKSFDNEKTRREISEFNPDITISTHYYGEAIISYYNKLGICNSKMMTVLTDYTYHKIWSVSHKKVDAFIVANDVVKNEMIDDGIDSKKIYPVGLPFNQNKLLNIKSKNDIIKQYKIDKTKKTYVFFGGGSAGSMAYLKYFKSLVKKRYPINLIFVCGKNKELESHAKKFINKSDYQNVFVTGFVKDVYSLLNVADFVISKPGGATVTECLIMKCPLICIPGVGGQEKYNARFVVRKGYGLKTRGILWLNYTVNKTLNNKNLCKRFKKNLAKLEPNNSLAEILKITNKLTK